MMAVIDANYKSVGVRRATIGAMRRGAMVRALGVGLFAGTAYVLWRAIEANREDPELGWEPAPFPPRPRSGDPSDRAPSTWVEPDDGTCPASHPVKAKLASGIYHEPGGGSYARTRPDRCYREAPAAQADGLRAAKR
jgi:hypothetical protein